MSQGELSFWPSPRRGGRDGDGRDSGHRDAPPVLTVAQVVRGANRLLELRFSNIWVEGEVSNLKIGPSGHAFFTLKDEHASLPCAMWRSAVEQLRFALEDGQHLRVFGRLGVFAKQGRFQMYADKAEPAGLGALMLELEQRRAKLAAEGLFAADRKRPLPRWPRRIGVVTSAHGAAIHDILQVARRRCPSCILLSPAIVQGPDAPASLRRALDRLVRLGDVDVVIIGRGGGSMEDLWAFNDERLARAIAACPVPVVSAVGHEVDVTICDLVADVRAATPSQAAELVVPDLLAARRALEIGRRHVVRAFERAVIDHRARLEGAHHRLVRAGRELGRGHRARLVRIERALRQQHPRMRIAADRRRLDALVRRLEQRGKSLSRSHREQLAALHARAVACARRLPRRGRARFDALVSRLRAAGKALPRDARLRLVRAAGALDALSPLAVLHRGYAVVTREDGRVVTDASQVRPGDAIDVRLHRGVLRARTTSTRTDEDDRPEA